MIQNEVLRSEAALLLLNKLREPDVRVLRSFAEHAILTSLSYGIEIDKISDKQILSAWRECQKLL